MKTEVVIDVPCGGSFEVLGVNPDIGGGDLVVAIDTAGELARLPQDSRVIRVTLARRHTVKSLVGKLAKSRGFQSARRALHNHQGDLADGLGRIPALGAMAFEELRLTGRLDRVLEEILVRVRQLTNGAPGRIKVRICCSNSGGTGHGIAHKVAAALVKKLESTQAVIVVEHLRVGAQTYNGLGRDYIRFNNGAGVAEDIKAVMLPPTGNEICYLDVCELPMPNDPKDKSFRDRYAGLYLQARLAEETQEVLVRGRTFIRPLDRITVSQAGFWVLPASINPTASAAARLLPEVTGLLGDHTGNTGILPNFELVVSVEVEAVKESNYSELVTLVKTPGWALPSGYWNQYIAAQYGHLGEVRVVVQGQEMPLGAMLVSLPNTIGSFKDRLRFLFGLRQDVQQRLEEIQQGKQGVSEVAGQLDKMQQSIDNVAGRLYPGVFPAKDLMSRVTAFIRSILDLMAGVRGRETLVKALESFLKTYVEQEKGLAGLKAQEAVLLGADSAIKQKIDEHQVILARIQQWLSRATQVGGVSLVGLFTVRELDDGVLTDLLLAAQSNSHSHFEAALRRSLSGVTRQGLGAILLGTDAIGAADISSEVLARRLSEDPPEITPSWGGFPRDDEPTTLIVVPPMLKDLRDELGQALRALGLPRQILQTDTVSGGVAVVLLRIYNVEELSQVQTASYEEDFKRAVTAGWYPLARVTGSADVQAQSWRRTKRSGARTKRQPTKPPSTSAATPVATS